MNFGESSQTRGFFSAYGLDGHNTQERRISAARAEGDILDGLSNTIAVSESCTADSNVTYKVKGNIWFRSQAAAVMSPSECQINVDTANPNFFTPSTANVTTRGFSFADGRPGINGFQTAGPPNTLNCRNNTNAGSGHFGWNYGVVTASSYHSGGVNCLFADGAVKFISETINCGDQGSKRNRNSNIGPSDYGVWGALGSIHGGESVTL